MRIGLSRITAAAVAIVALGACSDDPTAPLDQEIESTATTDVASSEGNMIVGDMFLLIGAEATAVGVPAGAAMEFSAVTPPSGCTQGEDGGFVCPTHTTENATWNRTFFFYDGTTIQDGYDAATTDSIKFITSGSGTITRDGYSATFSRNRTAVLSGLDGQETSRTWNAIGAGTRTETWTGDRGTRTYDVESQDTVTNLVMNLPRSSNPYPASGSIVHRAEIHVEFSGARGTGTRDFVRRVQVTFNGTSTAALNINGRNCTLNLETRAVSCSQ